MAVAKAPKRRVSKKKGVRKDPKQQTFIFTDPQTGEEIDASYRHGKVDDAWSSLVKQEDKVRQAKMRLDEAEARRKILQDQFEATFLECEEEIVDAIGDESPYCAMDESGQVYKLSGYQPERQVARRKSALQPVDS